MFVPICDVIFHVFFAQVRIGKRRQWNHKKSGQDDM